MLDPATVVVVPVVLPTVNDVKIVCNVRATTRPYASVVITGTCVLLPTVVAPGPVAVRTILDPLIVKLPAPELVLTTLVPLSYTPCAYNVLLTTVLPVKVPTCVIPV